MIVIGELINTSREEINDAVERRDADFLVNLAKEQEKAGASYVDVNAGSRIHDEIEVLTWLIELLQDVVEVPLCIDSPNDKAIEAALEIYTKGTPLVNSITAEEERLESLLPILEKHKPQIVALCMDDSGMPNNVQERLDAADVLVEALRGIGYADEDIFFDPVVKPLSVDDTSALQVIEACAALREKYPDVNITSGLSNISYGLPLRTDINQSFLCMAMYNGMNSAIIDPLDERMMTLVMSSEACLGIDPYCVKYLKYQQEKNK